LKTKKKKPSSTAKAKKSAPKKAAPKKTAAKKVAAKKSAVAQPAAKSKKPVSQVGIFGGSFNPFHLGHLNSLLAVRKEFNLKEILVIPTNQTPGKPAFEGPVPEQRLEMANIGTNDYRDFLVVDDREIKRGGESYTIDTLKELIAENPNTEFALIIGADHLQNFYKWKDYEKILALADVIVTSRPGALLPYKKDDLPEWLQNLAVDVSRDGAILSTGKTVRHYQLQDKVVSGTEIRKCIRSGLRVDKFLSLPVEKYVKDNEFYRPSKMNKLDFKQVTKFVAEVLFDKKGFNVKGYDLSNCQAPSEFAIICSGTSTRHVGALGEGVHYEVKKKFGLNPLSVEGVNEGRWALIDFGGLIVHVFYDFVRQEYKLEDLWKERIDLHLKDTSAPASLSFQS
jgi:nicotinate-nucleotide adenylyltransferase